MKKAKLKNFYTIVIHKDNQIQFMLLIEKLSEHGICKFYVMDYIKTIHVTLQSMTTNTVKNIVNHINLNSK